MPTSELTRHYTLTDTAFVATIADLLAHPRVRSMENFLHHGRVNCLDHCLSVAHTSFLLSKSWGLNSRAAARAGLLHDYYLYDWHIPQAGLGLHGFSHPRVALANATRDFELSLLEQDIILKHMWPLTPALPRYRESWVVLLADKYCALRDYVRGFARRLGFARLRATVRQVNLEQD